MLAAGDEAGNVYFLTLENVEHGPLVVAAWRGPSDGPPAFGCLHCRVWSEVSASALGTELPCPNCRRPVKLNLFTIEADWRPVAAAWAGNVGGDSSPTPLALQAGSLPHAGSPEAGETPALPGIDPRRPPLSRRRSR